MWRRVGDEELIRVDDLTEEKYRKFRDATEVGKKVEWVGQVAHDRRRNLHIVLPTDRPCVASRIINAVDELDARSRHLVEEADRIFVLRPHVHPGAMFHA